jgi:hypothetical protein
MLMICFDESRMNSVQQTEPLEGCGLWVGEMERRGVLRGGAGLQPSTSATTVRVRGDSVLISDGPFAETKDQVGGFNLIECQDLDEAIEIASKHPAAPYGAIEVRPLWEP